MSKLHLGGQWSGGMQRETEGVEKELKGSRKKNNFPEELESRRNRIQVW